VGTIQLFEEIGFPIIIMIIIIIIMIIDLSVVMSSPDETVNLKAPYPGESLASEGLLLLCFGTLSGCCHSFASAVTS